MIKQMSDLSDPISNNTTSTPVGVSSGIQKEQEPIASSETGLTETMTEIEVSPELEKAGIEKRSETIELPPDLQKMGVVATGPSQPVVTATVSLPLTDDQIAQGLKHGVTNSWRWLAEWCIRRIKQFHKRITHA